MNSGRAKFSDIKILCHKSFMHEGKSEMRFK